MADPQDIDFLAPCPFCGGAAKRLTIGEDEPNNAGGDVICCSVCDASSHVEFGRKENLVSAWNRRAIQPAPDTLRQVRESARIPDHAAWAARGRWREAYEAVLALLPKEG